MGKETSYTEAIDELKVETKKYLIEQLGSEEAFHKYIGNILKTLVPVKESVDFLFTDMGEAKRKVEFKKAVMDRLVFDMYHDQDDQILWMGIYELALDVFEF